MQTLDREKVETKLVLYWKQLCEEYANTSYRDDNFNNLKIVESNRLKTKNINKRDNLIKFLETKLENDQYYFFDKTENTDKLDIKIKDIRADPNFKYQRLENLRDSYTKAVLTKVALYVDYNTIKGESFFSNDISTRLVKEVFDSNKTYNHKLPSGGRRRIDIVVNLLIHDELVTLLNEKEFEELYNYSNVCVKNHSLGIINENLRVLTAKEYKEFMLYKDKTGK